MTQEKQAITDVLRVLGKTLSAPYFVAKGLGEGVQSGAEHSLKGLGQLLGLPAKPEGLMQTALARAPELVSAPGKIPGIGGPISAGIGGVTGVGAIAGAKRTGKEEAEEAEAQRAKKKKTSKSEEKEAQLLAQPIDGGLILVGFRRHDAIPPKADHPTQVKAAADEEPRCYFDQASFLTALGLQIKQAHHVGAGLYKFPDPITIITPRVEDNKDVMAKAAALAIAPMADGNALQLPELVKLMPKVAALAEAVAVTFVKRATIADSVGKVLARAYGGVGRGAEYATSLGGRYPSRVSGAIGGAAIPYEDILKNLGKERGFFGGLRPEHERAVRQARDIFGRARLASLLGVGGLAATAGARRDSDELTPNLNVDEDKMAATKADLIKMAIDAGVNEGRVRYIASQIKDAGDRRARRGRWRKKGKGDSKQDTWQQRYGKPAAQVKASGVADTLTRSMLRRARRNPYFNWVNKNPGTAAALSAGTGGLIGGAFSPEDHRLAGALTGAAGSIFAPGILAGFGGAGAQHWQKQRNETNDLQAKMLQMQGMTPQMYGMTPQASIPLMTKDSGFIDRIAQWIVRRGTPGASAALHADPVMNKNMMLGMQNLKKELEAKSLAAAAAQQRRAAPTALELPAAPSMRSVTPPSAASEALPQWLQDAGKVAHTGPMQKAAIIPEMMAGAGLGRMMAMGAGGGLGGGYMMSRFGDLLTKLRMPTFGRAAKGVGRPLMTVGALSLGLPLAMAFAGRPVTKIQIGDRDGDGGGSSEMSELRELMQLRLLSNMAKGVGDTGAAVGRSAAGGLRDLGELVQ